MIGDVIGYCSSGNEVALLPAHPTQRLSSELVASSHTPSLELVPATRVRPFRIRATVCGHSCEGGRSAARKRFEVPTGQSAPKEVLTGGSYAIKPTSSSCGSAVRVCGGVCGEGSGFCVGRGSVG